MTMTPAERREWVEAHIADWNPDARFLDGFDGAIIGYATQATQDPLVVYDYEQMIAIILEDGGTPDEAVEYFHHNVHGGWVGPQGPLVLFPLDQEDERGPMPLPQPLVHEPDRGEELGEVPPVLEG